MSDWAAISDAIASATGQPFQYASHSSVGGGCINRTYRLRGRDGRDFFVKLNDVHHHQIPSSWLRTGFAAEAAGLGALAATHTVRVPQPVAQALCGAQSFLVLEYLALQGRGNAAQLGEQLAAMHRCTSSRFGFAHDNFLGTTPQPNGWMDDWVAFWRERRLGYQLRLAAENGHRGNLQNLGERLMDALPAFFAGYALRPSLLHGDLWGGNHGYLADGTPAIFDPASYYGDRECDLAMTELFGGYGTDFYAAYRASYQLDAGYAVRRELYNLYHILNHANLFGGGYARQAEGMMRRLLAEAG
ncbi:MAG TPA: fructosamine kinase family protein [Nevskia sp.]|nr:fructosamine kinase family protein [Nevskia sp.]